MEANTLLVHMSTSDCLLRRFHTGNEISYFLCYLIGCCLAFPIQHLFSSFRITSFQDNWIKLEEWFGNAGRKSILMRVNADVATEELYMTMKSILQKAIVQKQEGKKTLIHWGNNILSASVQRSITF